MGEGGVGRRGEQTFSAPPGSGEATGSAAVRHVRTRAYLQKEEEKEEVVRLRQEVLAAVGVGARRREEAAGGARE